jgi:hypothetical protein
MGVNPVTAVPVPTDSLICRSLPRVDYQDAYAVTVPPGSPPDPEAWAAAVLDSPPGWVAALMRFRNLAVAPFGLKTGGPRGADRRLLPFPLLDRTDDEVLLGLDDRHLDFRFSVLIRDGTLTGSTAVYLPSRLGRAYFLPVRAIHPAVVKAMIRGAATKTTKATVPPAG